MDALSRIFVFFVLAAIFVLVLVVRSYNALQRLSQEVKERASNVQVAIGKKIELVNQLIDVVRNFQEAEQFTQLKVSSDNTAQAISGAYQASGAVLSSVQALAERFPDLKANTQYHRLIDSIQACEGDIETRRNAYNAAVKHYNTGRSSIPTVFVASFLGFSEAPYLQLESLDGAPSSTLKSFRTDDGERLNQLLGVARDNLAGGAKRIAQQAGVLGGAVVDRVRTAAASGNGEQAGPPLPGAAYFYLDAANLPKGPFPLATIQARVAAGELRADVRVARSGETRWLALSDMVDSETAP